MHAISTMRWPSRGSRPVVSVSKTISRIVPPTRPAKRGPTPPGDPRSPVAQTSDDRAQWPEAEVAAQAGRYHEIGSLTFLAIGHLVLQYRRKAPFGHPASLYDAMLLDQPRR